jgi:uncharacterized repeat protein (TIGR01451 family)
MFNSSFRKSIVLGPLLAVVIGFPDKLTAAPTFVNATVPDLPAVARGVPMGGALEIFDLNLDKYGKTALRMERFAVFAPDAKIEVVNGPALSPPDAAYFRGRHTGDEESIVMLSVFKDGRVHGMISGKDGVWLLEKKSGSASLQTRKTKLAQELKNRKFDCDSDKMAAASSGSGLSSSSGAAASGLGGSGAPLNVQYTAKMIVDTDYEYWLKFWNANASITDTELRVAKTAADATEYVGDLIAFASSMYEREVDTNLLIIQTRLFATNSDPYSANSNFCGCDGDGKLDEVQDVWDDNPTPRTLVHFISGKTEGCGCAYTGDGDGVLCSQSSGYGASSAIGTGFNIDDPGFTWEGMVIGHEIGHNFGSPHTHNFCDEFGISDPVDICVSEDGTGDVANCTGVANSDALPGLDSLTGGTSGAGNGTMMSYCHQQSGGFANIAHTFGEFQPYGKAAWRVPAKMLGNVQAAGCMDVAYTGGDLRLQKDCKPDQPLPAGGTASCTITVDNLGPDNAQGIKVVDTLLSDGTFTIGTVSATKGTDPMPAGTCTTPPNPQNQNGTVTCNLGLLDAGHKAVIEVPLTANTAQTNISDSAEVSSDSTDPNQFNNVASDNVQIVASADLRISKSDSADPVIAGGASFSYNISVTNDGPSSAAAVVVTDQVPAGLKLLSVSGSNGASCNLGDNDGSPAPTTCNFGTVNSGASRTMTITVQALPDTRGQVTNDASVSSSTADPDNSDNLDTENTLVNGLADLGVEKLVTSSEAVAGANVDYQINVTNNGPSTATHVVLTDTLDPALTFVSSTPVCVNNPAGTLTCTLGTILPSETKTVFVSAKLSSAATGTIVNTATATGAEPDNNAGNNTDDVSSNVIARADLWLDKVSNFPTGNPSGTIVYSLTVYNKAGCEQANGIGNDDDLLCWNASGGPSDAQTVTVTDTLPLDPKKFVVQYVSPNCTYNPVPHNVVCKVADSNGNFIPLKAGDTASSFQIQAVIKGSVGTFTNTATVTSPTDVNAVNNTDVVKTTVSGSTGKKGGGR